MKDIEYGTVIDHGGHKAIKIDSPVLDMLAEFGDNRIEHLELGSRVRVTTFWGIDCNGNSYDTSCVVENVTHYARLWNSTRTFSSRKNALAWARKWSRAYHTSIWVTGDNGYIREVKG